MAVRIAIEYHIVALPRTPFCHYVAFHPQGSVSLDSRVASLPYESSSLATSRGNEKFRGTFLLFGRPTILTPGEESRYM